MAHDPRFQYDLSFNEYQEKAATTAIYPHRHEIGGLTYTVLGLNGEAGEVAEKLKKTIRDNNGKIDEARTYEIAQELGDVLWYVAETASQLGLSLGQIAEINVEKLYSRKDRGQLQGSGDER